jgi:cellulose synthase/poly-beta-1,6-N-acetylglucosamine synthase-like glycosyltransferase
MNIITTLLIAASLYIFGITLYLLVLTVAAYFFRKKTGPSNRLRLAVVIPAHNEEGQIETTIEAVFRSTYPRDLYHVFVIADNCTDRTAELAAAGGASVFERHDPDHRGKGQALDWFFTNCRSVYGRYDGVLIMDADTLSDQLFMAEMSASLSHPDVLVVQGYGGVSNTETNWRTALLSAAFAVNHIRPAGRSMIGGSAGLRGNGMGFRTSVLEQHGWPAYSMVEDAEFSLKLLLGGTLVHYNPDAVVASEMPTQAAQAERQRMRWEGAWLLMARAFMPSLLFQFLKRPRVCFLDAFIGILIPPFSLLVLSQVVFMGMAAMVHPAALLLLLVCLAVDLFYVLSGLIQRRASRTVWMSLFSAPLFVLWKLPLYLKMLRRRRHGWERTKRQSELHNSTAL